MSRVDRNHFSSRRIARTGLLSVSVLAAGLVFAAPAKVHAQSLRGQITEEQAADDLLIKRKPGRTASQSGAQASSEPAIDSKTGGQAKNRRDQNRPAPEEYQPVSSGALTAVEEADQRDPDATIADETTPPPAPNDPFADSEFAPAPRPASSGKKAKADAKNTRAAARRPGQRPQTAAQRLAAKGQDVLTTGTTRSATIDADNRKDLKLDGGAERELAVEGLARRREDKPFDPVGIRAGSFVLRPSFEQGLTYTTNANSSPNGSEAVQSESTLRLNAVSDWSQHYAAVDAYGVFRKSLSGEELQQTEGGIAGTLDYTLSNELKVKTAAAYAFKPESASSPVMLGNVLEQPLRHTFNASAGLAKEVGKFEFGVTTSGERNIYGEAELDTGATLNQDDRNATLATIALRGGYEISPAIKPFVELELGRRIYDLETDSAGYQRSANRLGAKAGLQLDMREKLTGEFSAGWLRESFDDQRLDAISGLALAADLRWSPERETTIGLRASTTIEGTTTAGESGSLMHSGRLSVERQIRTNLSTNATLGVDWRTYNGTGDHDLVLSAEAGATWWLNRYLGITGRLKHEQLTSDLPGRDYKTDSVFLGVKVQR